MLNYPESITKKIMSPDELKRILGRPKRKKKVVMCHGTFDIVHPGHIRHLIYAKEKGPILVVSITADKYVTKNAEQPYIPEELRARNLAALEMVDYVVIDHQQTPIEMILKIKPDYFIKGFEYGKDGIHPKTEEEIKVISSYGGEVIFSPGDVVHSSSHLLTIKKPKISTEKLVAIMDAEGIDFDKVLATLDSFQGTKVHVIGDTIVDKYVYCSVLGPTTKTPTFSVKREDATLFVGGAGVVAKHLKSLGADVSFTTVLGNDDLKDFVLNDLKDWGVKTNVVIDDARPTTLKERFWADGYKLLQVDTVDNSMVTEKTLQIMCQYLSKDKADIVIFSDFRHGLFNRETIKILTDNVPSNAIKVADSQVSNRWGNILDFNDFDIIIPNEKEARFAMGDQDSGVRPLGTGLYHKSGSKYLILKLGERGIMTFRNGAENPRDFFGIESFVQDFVDGMGAGDAMLATASLAYANSSNILISSILGNSAAAVVCESDGNIPVSIEKVKNNIGNLRKISLV